jgi:MFS family permease
VIADIMRGTGRYNLAQGAIATVQGMGASLSGLAAGVIVDHFGYSAGFLAAGAAAAVALAVFALWMPETAEPETGRHDDRTQPAGYSRSRPDPKRRRVTAQSTEPAIVTGRPSHRCRPS